MLVDRQQGEHVDSIKQQHKDQCRHRNAPFFPFTFNIDDGLKDKSGVREGRELRCRTVETQWLVGVNR
jgi:hypothetical protein